MTRLELAICEAENNGDIDIYTRDMMLDMINERVRDEAKRESMAKAMQADLFTYLKKYITQKDFKDKYKDFLYLINIKKDGYSEFNTTIEITRQQDGIDWNKVEKWQKEHKKETAGLTDEEIDKMNPYYKNDWYTELLDVGSRYLKSKYKKEMRKCRIGVTTGDGDEGHIYIIDLLREG